MKEMKYSAKRKIELLDTGTFYGFTYYILNLGTHPTAYIKIPKIDKRYYGKDIDSIMEMGDIEAAHGGITYAKDYLYISETQKICGWFIGWDYAHVMDYGGYEELLPKEMRTGGKKWTTEEIKDDTKKVCYEIKIKGMSIADEMFNKLGYVKYDNHPEQDEEENKNKDYFVTQDVRQIIYEQKDTIDGNNCLERIVFEPFYKYFYAEGFKNGHRLPAPLNIKEVEAIYEKCKELGWNNK